MKTVRDICQYVGSKIGGGAVCVETGCTYVCQPGNEIHTTTNNIYEFVAWNHGIFYSLDIDPEHIAFAQEMTFPLRKAFPGADLYFMEGDSIASLKELRKEWSGMGPGNSIDLLCLDSAGEEDHMVQEFTTIFHSLNPARHYILVDDIHNPNSVKHRKMVPLLKKLQYSCVEITTPTGMLLAARGDDLVDIGV